MKAEDDKIKQELSDTSDFDNAIKDNDGVFELDPDYDPGTCNFLSLNQLLCLASYLISILHSIMYRR